MFLRGLVSDACARTRPISSPMTVLAFLSMTLATACSMESPTGPDGPTASAAMTTAGIVSDLEVISATESTITLGWTEVPDRTGAPASYRVRYGAPLVDWSSGTIGCAPEIPGASVGSRITCTVEGLVGETQYDFQLVSYHSVEGRREGSQFSNVSTGRTATPPAPALTALAGIWIGPAEIAALSTTSAAWANLLAKADMPCGIVDLTDQEQSTNTCIFAKALVFARTGVPTYRDHVLAAIGQIVRSVASGPYAGRALALGRELGTYVVAADLVGLPTHDPALDKHFRNALRVLRTTPTPASPGAPNLIECHENRPNNWGAHCGATRAAIAVYLGDATDLARAAQVLAGYLGDRAAYAGFDFGGPEADLTWQCDPAQPVGINPAHCSRDGALLDGVLADDQRRAGAYTWPAPQENYVWEALQGLLAQALILHRAGYPVWEWQDRALLRATEWLHGVNGFPATGDDTWLPYIVNRFYGTSFPVPATTRPGKNFGFTDWTLS